MALCGIAGAIFRGSKVNDRPCTSIEVVHPVPRNNFRFHLLRVFIDEELKVPIRYELYGWPRQPGGPAELVEEYTYVNLKLNNGYGDADFDPRNPRYASSVKRPGDVKNRPQGASAGLSSSVVRLGEALLDKPAVAPGVSVKRPGDVKTGRRVPVLACPAVLRRLGEALLDKPAVAPGEA